MQKKRRMRYLSSMLITAAVLLWLLVAPHTAKAANISLNETNFPDAAFRTAVKSAFDLNNDNSLSSTEISKAKKLDASSSGIASTTGLQYLTALQELNVQYNQLQTLDVSKNTALTTLICNGNTLSALDVSMLTDLVFLDCSENSIEELNLLNNGKLERLEAYENWLTTINLSNNVLLTYLDLRDNEILKTIGVNNSNMVSVTKNTALTYFDCSNTQLPMIDVSKCPELTELYADEAKLTTLNVGSNPKLVVLHAAYNDLTMLDLYKNPLLEELSICCNDRLEYVYFSKLPKLIYLDIMCTGIKSLDVSASADLEVLYGGGGPLNSLTLGSHPKLADFNVGDCYITELDISGCPMLVKAYKNPSTSGVTFIYDEGVTIITEGVPVITTQPKSVTVAIGATVKLTTAATGTNLTYQWQYRNSSDDTWKNSTMACAKTNTFTFTAAESHSGHQYRCVIVSNGKATANTNTATVTVTPKITTQPKDTSIAIDGTVKLTVAATGTNLTYQWQYRNSSTDSWKNSTMACAKTNTFTFTAAESHSGHQYRCLVSNGKGTATSNAAIVTVRPKITTQPKDTTIAVGGTVKLTVAAKGTNLKYQWQYRNSSSDSWKNSTMACAKTNTFTFTAAESHSGHQYRCGVSNGKGTTYTNAATVTVTSSAAPKITTQPKDTTVAIGATAKLTVAASGSNLSYQWQYRNSSSDSWKNSTMACAKTTTFSFTAAESHSGHQYRCVVSNGSGTVNSNTVTVTVTPKITTQPKDTTIAIDGTVKLTVAATGTNLTYQWQYRNSSTDTWKNSTMACAKTTTFSFTAAESHSGHQYRCAVSNGKGTAYTNAATVTVTPKITTQPKDTTIAVGGTVKLTVAAKGTNLTYQWQYRNSSTDTWKNSTMACAKTTTFSFTAAASHSGHQYRCIVSNGKGNAYSNAVTVTVK